MMIGVMLLRVMLLWNCFMDTTTTRTMIQVSSFQLPPPVIVIPPRVTTFTSIIPPSTSSFTTTTTSVSIRDASVAVSTRRSRSTTSGGSGGGSRSSRTHSTTSLHSMISLSSSVQELVTSSNTITQLFVSSVIGFGIPPLIQQALDANRATENPLDETEYQNTVLFGIISSLAISARVYTLLLLLGFVFEENHLIFGIKQIPFIGDDVTIQQTSPVIAFYIFVAYCISIFKHRLLMQLVSGDKLGRVELYDQLLDFILILITISNILYELHIDVNQGLQSIFAASGVSAVIFSLASKGLVEQIVSGLILKCWDAINENDCIKLGDGTTGIVKDIGLVETTIVGFDNIVVNIPNSQITSQRISNLSRITQSQVLQTLRFKYTDLNKLPKVLNDIKYEIEISCNGKNNSGDSGDTNDGTGSLYKGLLITDGSKPFQVVLTTYQNDHIECVVNCHLNNAPPGSDEFVANRSRIILAIAKAMQQNSIEFAIPSIINYHSNNDNAYYNGNSVGMTSNSSGGSSITRSNSGGGEPTSKEV